CVNLIGVCQGGWMALVYAARYPSKIRGLVLAGAPVDINAGKSELSRVAHSVPSSVFKQLVELGGGGPLEGAAARAQHLSRVDLQEFLVRMLASAVRGHRRDGAFHDLEQGLLYALARDVAGDRGVVGLAADLVDLVDIDDAALGALDVVVGGLQQLEDESRR